MKTRFFGQKVWVTETNIWDYMYKGQGSPNRGLWPITRSWVIWHHVAAGPSEISVFSIRQHRERDWPGERSDSRSAALWGGSTKEPGSARTGQKGQRPIPDKTRTSLKQQPHGVTHRSNTVMSCHWWIITFLWLFWHVRCIACIYLWFLCLSV